jgi:hypothetical protein
MNLEIHYWQNIKQMIFTKDLLENLRVILDTTVRNNNLIDDDNFEINYIIKYLTIRHTVPEEIYIGIDFRKSNNKVSYIGIYADIPHTIDNAHSIIHINYRQELRNYTINKILNE